MPGTAVMKDNVRLYAGEDGTILSPADKVSNVQSIGEVGTDTDEIDATCIDSAAKENKAGFDDNGQVDIVQNITADEYAKWKAWQKAKTAIVFGVFTEDEDGHKLTTLAGHGWIKTVKWGGAQVGGLLTVTATIRISGELSETFSDPPVVIPGEVLRGSIAEATIDFVPDSDGKYYYAVVADGAAAPTVDVSGAGTACVKDTETTISLTDLADGAQDIYIVVKSTDGTVKSTPVKVDIPDYV